MGFDRARIRGRVKIGHRTWRVDSVLPKDAARRRFLELRIKGYKAKLRHTDDGYKVLWRRREKHERQKRPRVQQLSTITPGGGSFTPAETQAIERRLRNLVSGISPSKTPDDSFTPAEMRGLSRRLQDMSEGGSFTPAETKALKEKLEQLSQVGEDKNKPLPSGLIDTKTREQIGEYIETKPPEPEKVTLTQPDVPKDMFYVAPTLLAAASKTQPKVQQLDKKITQVLKDIETHAEQMAKVEKVKAQELAGTGQFYVSPELKAKQITHEDIENLIEVTKQEWDNKSEKEKLKILEMTGTGQFGVGAHFEGKQFGVITSAQQMKKHLEDMKRYNTEVTAYNKHIEELNDSIDLLDDKAKKLPLDTIKNYNDKVTEINKIAIELEEQAGKINLEDKEAVGAYNKKVNDLNYKIAELKHDEYKVKLALEEIEKFNLEVERINKSIEDNPAPIEPYTPRTTVGGTLVLAEEGLKVRWAEATAKELSTKEKATNVAGLLAEMFVPGVWARHWGEMGNIEKGINIALDIAILVPFIRLAGFGVKAGLRALPRGLAKQMLKAETQQIARTRAIIKATYGEAMAESFDDVARVQLKYFDTLTKLQKAKGAKATKLEKIAQSLKEELEASARTFSKRMIDRGLLVEDSLVAEAFKRMPDDLVKHTQQAAEMTIKPKVKLKTAQKELAKAQVALDAAQAKYPTDPTKWQDLLVEVMAKHQQVAVLKGQDAVKLHKQLVKARAQLADIDATMKRVARGSDIYPSLVHSRNLAQTKVSGLANKLRGAIISMEVYAGEAQGGYLGRMGVATPTRIRPPLSTLGTGTGTGLRVGTKASTSALVAAFAKAIPKDQAKIIVGDIDDPEIATYIKAKTMAAVDFLRNLRAREEGLTDEQLKEQLKEKLKDMTKNAPRVELRTELSTKARAIEKVALKVATPVKVPTKVPPLKPKVVPRLKGKSDKQKRRQIEQAGGAVGLRMGELHGKDNWLVKVYPYTGPQFRLFGRKPKGAKLVKGPGSGYESAFLYGVTPDTTVKLQSGFQPILLVPSNGSVRAMFPESLSGKSMRISPRPPRITPRPARITR